MPDGDQININGSFKNFCINMRHGRHLAKLSGIGNKPVQTSPSASYGLCQPGHSRMVALIQLNNGGMSAQLMNIIIQLF